MYVELNTCVLFPLTFDVPVAEKIIFLRDTEFDSVNIYLVVY